MRDEIQRYDAIVEDERDDGKYVYYADHAATVAALEAERDDLIENLSLCKGNELAVERDTLQREVERLQEALQLIVALVNRVEGEGHALNWLFDVRQVAKAALWLSSDATLKGSDESR